MNRLVLLLIPFISPVISAQVEFTPTGCGYSVTFPRAPIITTIFAPQIGDYEQANVGSDADGSYFLRAECIPLPLGAGTAEALDLKVVLVQYAEGNGLQSVEYEFGPDSLGRYGRLRGFKTISGRRVTYGVLSYVGLRSYLTLYAGGASESYPQTEVYDFLFRQSLVGN